MKLIVNLELNPDADMEPVDAAEEVQEAVMNLDFVDTATVSLAEAAVDEAED